MFVTDEWMVREAMKNRTVVNIMSTSVAEERLFGVFCLFAFSMMGWPINMPKTVSYLSYQKAIPGNGNKTSQTP